MAENTIILDIIKGKLTKPKKYTIQDFNKVLGDNLQEFKDKFDLGCVSKKPEKQICYKNNKPCKYDCKGLCKEAY